MIDGHRGERSRGLGRRHWVTRASVVRTILLTIVVLTATSAIAPPLGPPHFPPEYIPRREVIAPFQVTPLEHLSPIDIQRYLLDPCAKLNTKYGFVEVDLPLTVMINQPFKADVVVQPCTNAPRTPIEVRMEQTGDVQYEPRVFTVMPGNHQTVEIKILKAPGGLAEIIAVPARPWLPAYISINAGFEAALKAQMDETAEAGSVQAVSIHFVDSDGMPVAVGAPVAVAVSAEKAMLRANSAVSWSQELSFMVGKGGTSTPSFEVKFAASAPDRAVLSALVKINETLTIRDQKFSITLVPPWWLQMLVGILGGLLHATTKLMTGFSHFKRGTRFVRVACLKLFTGGFAGCLAYLLASWNILGIRVDTTSLRAFAVLGFLFSYLGVDAVMKRLVPSEDREVAKTKSARKERGAA